MSKNYSENRKQLVLDAMDGKEVDRVPSGFWFHFLPDEIHANAFKEPALNQQLLAGESKYISEFQPDFVKIMTDGFFPYNNDLLYTAKSAKELANIQPLADDDPWFTQQIAYAKEITSRYGQQVATFYNIFCAGTTLKFMQPGTLDSEDAFLAKLALEEKEDLKKAFEVISGDLAKLAKRLIKEAGVTGIYLSVQNLLGDGITEELYQEVLAPGENSVIGLVIRKENAQQIKDLPSFADFSGKLVPIAPQDARYMVIDSYNKEHSDKPIKLDSSEAFQIADAYSWVLEGRYDAYLEVELSYKNNIVKDDAPYHQFNDKLTYIRYKGIPTYPIFNKEQKELAAEYDKAIEELRAEGKIAELEQKYFGESLSQYLQ